MAKKEEFKITKTENIPLNFYAVRSKDGKWLRSKGYNGYGDSWVDDIMKAKIWMRPGAAKAQVTFWANSYPQYGIPDLVQITSGVCNYLDQTERVAEVKRKKRIADAQQKVTNLEMRINNYLTRTRLDQSQVDKWKNELILANKQLDLVKG
jgi:hypothetical protein